MIRHGPATVPPSAARQAGDAPAVVLADDHLVVRAGLRRLLEHASMRVLAEAGTVAEAVAAVRAHRPDVLLLDLAMPGGSGLDAIPSLLAACPGMAIVVLTMRDDAAVARAALAAGASAFVLKEAADTELIEAIRRAARGERHLDPRVGARLAAEPATAPLPTDGLTDRELEVLRLVALGHTNAEIAAQVGLSVRTVESHRAALQAKIGRTTRAELVAYALDRGLLTAPH